MKEYTSLIKTEFLCKTYYTGAVETEALIDVNVGVNSGEFIAITGQSGSGKSTFMHLLSLLDTPTKGVVYLDGKDVSSLSEKVQSKFRLEMFGFVFQDYALIPELTTIENVSLPLMMQGVDNEICYKKAYDVLDKFGLKDRVNNLPGQISGGEQQRVSIARAIANKPKIIFADEPTANLDSKTSQVILDTFKELNKEGQTILMVTHEATYSKQANRELILQDGKLIEDKIL